MMASEIESLESASTSLSEDSLNISFENITYTVSTYSCKNVFNPARKTILDNISGRFDAGELTVIMGQSGAGKSSLMDILSGYTKPTSGNIYVNGKIRNEKKFRRRSCYIFQDDKVNDMLTTQESLKVAAELKLGNHINAEMKCKRVEEILNSLGLDRARHTRAVNLSGGQRKRLAIGLELISDPPVMFLDEPTSGLDSSKAKQLVYLLHLLARQGRTVVATIHQPSATLLQMIDRVYAVVDGKCAYMGSEPSLVPYLERLNMTCPTFHNPIDFLIEISAKRVIQLVESSKNGKNEEFITNVSTDLIENPKIYSQVNSMYEEIHLTSLPTPKEDPTNKILLALKSTYSTSRWKQFITLTKRSLLSIWRNPSFTIMLLSIHIVMALLIGLLFYNIGLSADYIRDNYNFLYFSLMFLMFTAFSTVTISFPEQIPVVRREHFNRWYTSGAYYVSTIASTLPTQTICTLTYAGISYWLTGQPIEFIRFSLFTSTLLMVSYTALCVGLLNGAIFDVKNGVVFGPFFIMPFTIFSGFFLRYNDAPFFVRWLFQLSFLKHGLVGLMISIFGMDRARLDCTIDYCHYHIPKKFLEDNGNEDDTFSFVAIALVVICAVFVTSSYVILRIRLKNKW